MESGFVWFILGVISGVMFGAILGLIISACLEKDRYYR